MRKNKFLESRLAAIEKRLADLESTGRRFAYDGDSIPDQTVDLYGDHLSLRPVPERRPKRLGPPKKMSDELFAERRDHWVQLIEALWPEFKDATSTWGNIKALEKRLRVLFPMQEDDDRFRTLFANIGPLDAYLATKSNTGQPRRLAYVIAGLSGRLTAKYSVVRGVKNPSKVDIHFRAMGEHIRRLHPSWAKTLMSAGTRDTAMQRIPQGCKDCERFRLRPDRIVPALEEGTYPLTREP